MEFEKKKLHLEFIQATIGRMAQNSFSIKTWTVTLVSAVFAVSAYQANSLFVLLCYIPLGAFWGLDAYYLRQERLFRKHQWEDAAPGVLKYARKWGSTSFQNIPAPRVRQVRDVFGKTCGGEVIRLKTPPPSPSWTDSTSKYSRTRTGPPELSRIRIETDAATRRFGRGHQLVDRIEQCPDIPPVPKAFLLETLVSIARALCRTLESIATPSWVNTSGNFRRPPRPFFDIAICDIKDLNSSRLNWNIKSPGKRRGLRLTCSFNRPVATAYRPAKSESSITRRPRMRYILRSMAPREINDFRLVIPKHTNAPLVLFPQKQNTVQEVLTRVGIRRGSHSFQNTRAIALLDRFRFKKLKSPNRPTRIIPDFRMAAPC